MSSLPDWLSQLCGEELTARKHQGLLRELTTVTSAQGALVTDGAGQQLVNFSSNDYLGLAAHPRLLAAAQRAMDQFGWGAGASPLISGHSQSMHQLRRRLAQFKGTQDAVVFTTGYQANLGTLTALVDADDLLISDKLNHASLIDAARLTGCRLRVTPHNDLDKVKRLLAARPAHQHAWIVVESVFSMDGDLADVDGLSRLARAYDATLIVDEAHATGVCGPGGHGLVNLGPDGHPHTIVVGTLSKALGSVGGFVAAPKLVCDVLVNRARSLIYSTALPPAVCAAAVAALDFVEEFPGLGETLLAQAAWLRQQLSDRGWDTGASATQIVPLIVGPADQATALSRRLRDQGFWVPAVRPPTVPKNTSRLRLSLTAAHQPKQLHQFLDALVFCVSL